MSVQERPLTCLPAWKEATDQRTPASQILGPEADGPERRPPGAGDWQAYDIEILTAFLDW
jgi:hypothetical protein